MPDLTQAMVGLLLAVIIGVVMLTVSSNVITAGTTIYNVTNETHSGAASGAYVLDQTHDSLGIVEGGDTTFRVYNTSSNNDYNITDNYNMTYANGTLSDLRDNNGSYVTTEIGVDYDYYPSGYISNAITRTIVNYLPLLMAVVIIVAVVGLIALKP